MLLLEKILNLENNGDIKPKARRKTPAGFGISKNRVYFNASISDFTSVAADRCTRITLRFASINAS